MLPSHLISTRACSAAEAFHPRGSLQFLYYRLRRVLQAAVQKRTNHSVIDTQPEVIFLPVFYRATALKNGRKADAMSGQRSIAAKLREGGADYVIGPKGNQPALLADISLYFEHLGNCPESYDLPGYPLWLILIAVAPKFAGYALTTAGFLHIMRPVKGNAEEEYPVLGAQRGNGWCKFPVQVRKRWLSRSVPEPVAVGDGGCSRYRVESVPLRGKFRWYRGEIIALSQAGSGRFL